MNVSRNRKRVLPAVLLLVLVSCGAGALAQGQGVGGPNPLSDTLVPEPTLSPRDVVRIQLEALRHNDEQDRGIAVAFRFASPANRANTGPLPRFIAMIKEGPYALMLDFVDASYGPVETVADRARQPVMLTGPGSSITYWFYLSRQAVPPYVDCWMTDAVYIAQSAGQVAWAILDGAFEE